MTVLLEINDLVKEFGDRTLFDKVNLKIKYGEKIGLVGSNGTGKSTLANIIYGRESYNSGSILWGKNDVKIGYMKQDSGYDERFNTLSGGEKIKKRLTEILYENYDMLILDEPTNHLDYLGVEWLIKKVNQLKGTILIISHDRYFLDKCTNHIVEIEYCNLKSYSGNYSWYRQKKKEDYESALNAYYEQEKKKQNIESQIHTLKNWSLECHNGAAKKAIKLGLKKGGKEHFRAKAKKKDILVKSRIKKLQKIEIEGVNKPKQEEKILFSLDDAEKIGKVLVRAENISKSFESKVLFKNASFYIKQNEKIGLYGKNGCGKTTLIKAMLGETDIDGSIYLSPNRKIGYISQDIKFSDEDSSIIDLFEIQNREELKSIRTKLNLLGFKRETLDESVKKLSLGERMKLKILLMIQKKCNVLILDEPTNNIDIHVREKLEEVLIDYKGTIILVTHDMYMMKKVCKKMLVFENESINRYEYGLYEYLKKMDKSSDNNICKDKKSIEEEKMILENKISCILGKLSFCKIGSAEYIELDKEYNKLLKKKCEIFC